jgi:hypothetical protein
MSDCCNMIDSLLLLLSSRLQIHIISVNWRSSLFLHKAYILSSARYFSSTWYAVGFVKEVKNHINCVWTGYILQKPLGTRWHSNSKISGKNYFYQLCRKTISLKHVTEEKFLIMPRKVSHNVFGSNYFLLIWLGYSLTFNRIFHLLTITSKWK